jgi:hypothetical protein
MAREKWGRAREGRDMASKVIPILRIGLKGADVRGKEQELGFTFVG